MLPHMIAGDSVLSLRKGWGVVHLLDKHDRHCLLQCAVCQPLTRRLLEMNEKMFILQQGRMSCAKGRAGAIG